jgi:hypothetical protein
MSDRIDTELALSALRMAACTCPRIATPVPASAQRISHQAANDFDVLAVLWLTPRKTMATVRCCSTMPKLPWLALLFLAGCDAFRLGTDTPSSKERDRECASRAIADCHGFDEYDCDSRLVVPVNVARACTESLVAVECWSGARTYSDCDASATVGATLDGGLVRSDNNCSSAAITLLPPDSPEQAALNFPPCTVRCEQLGLGDCRLDPICTISSAQRFDSDRRCINAPEPVFCVDGRRSCDGGVSTFSRDGADYKFGTSCPPDSAYGAQPAGDFGAGWPTCGECYDLSVDACRANPRCSVVTGKAIQSDGECIATAVEELGCRANDEVCTSAITIASGPRGTYQLESSCVPARFRGLDAASYAKYYAYAPCGAGIATCEAWSVDKCLQDGRCRPITGRLLFPTNTCAARNPEVLGCMSADASCVAAVRYAKDRFGKPYMFSSGCVPAGWPELAIAEQPQQPWPSCN